MRVPFSKYHGNGNDFIIIDNRSRLFPADNRRLIRAMCERHFGIGADGLILLEPASKADFHMTYFNSDGNEGSMCGNGGRCIVGFASRAGLTASTVIFSGIDGMHEAKLEPGGIVKLKMKDVLSVDRDGEAYIIDTGSPHYVRFMKDIGKINMREEGRKIRYSPAFAKHGINVNFIEVSGQQLKIRTYERGVEDETLACGTGSVAAAIAALVEGKFTPENIQVSTLGGVLNVTVNHVNFNTFTGIWLSGPAIHVFDGTAETESFISDL